MWPIYSIIGAKMSKFDLLVTDIGVAAYAAARCPPAVQGTVIETFLRSFHGRVRDHAAHLEQDILLEIRRLLRFGAALIRDKSPALAYWKLVSMFTHSSPVVDFVNEYRILAPGDREKHARRIGQRSAALKVEAERLLEESRRLYLSAK